MAARTYRLRGSTTATASAITFIDIKRKGHIKGVYWAGLHQTDVADAAVCWEVSFSQGRQVADNDPTAVISNFALASCTAVPKENNFAHAHNYAVNVGDRIYLHALWATGNETQTVLCGLIVEES